MPANGKNRKKNRKQITGVPAPILASAPPPDADADRYRVTGWSGGNVELPLPSGQLCLVQKIDPTDLVARGIIDDFDMLSAAVQQNHVGPKSRSNPAKQQLALDKQLQELLSSPEKLQAMMLSIDQLIMSIVVLPEIQPKPEPDENGEMPELDPNVAYIHRVSSEDKNFILQWAFGGTSNLEQFREEFSELADGLDVGQDLETKAE